MPLPHNIEDLRKPSGWSWRSSPVGATRGSPSILASPSVSSARLGPRAIWEVTHDATSSSGPTSTGWATRRTSCSRPWRRSRPRAACMPPWRNLTGEQEVARRPAEINPEPAGRRGMPGRHGEGGSAMTKHATIRLRGLKVATPIPADRCPRDLVPADGPAGNPSITLELEGVGPVCTAVLNGKSYRRMLKASPSAARRGSRSCSRARSSPGRAGCRSSRARASRPCPGRPRRRQKGGRSDGPRPVRLAADDLRLGAGPLGGVAAQPPREARRHARRGPHRPLRLAAPAARDGGESAPNGEGSTPVDGPRKSTRRRLPCTAQSGRLNDRGFLGGLNQRALTRKGWEVAMRLRGSPRRPPPDDFPWFSEEQLREMRRQHPRHVAPGAPSLG